MNTPDEKVVLESPALMLRPAVPADMSAITALVIATAMFLPHEVEPVQEMMNDFHAGRLGIGHEVEVWTDDPGEPPVGVVYFGPNAMSARTWDLWMIAVSPDCQSRGIGSALLLFTEERVRTGGGSLLLIETSSLPKYAAARAFYDKHGYTEVARIPDFYADGDSKVIYSKRITA